MATDTKAHIDEPIEGFGIEDLFMSRTDARGVILSGNPVFRRLAGFDWSELIGAPHKVIRHKDMPKAAFRALWSTIEAGHPFGAYVKNRAKSGRYYWVFAVVVPVEGGYLSVRLKPTTDLLGAVEGLYAALCSDERNGVSIEDGVAKIEETVQSLGFRDYPDFMAHALTKEIGARATAMSQEVDPGMQAFEGVGLLLRALDEEVTQIFDLFDQIKNSPANLSIIGSHLSRGGEALQEVARNYDHMSEEMRMGLASLSDALESLLTKASIGRMGHCASLLYAEAIPAFSNEEKELSQHAHDAEMQTLHSAMAGLVARSRAGCRQIEVEVRGFTVQVARLRQLLSGLAVTRVVCRIEAAHVRGDASGIAEITQRLDEFQTAFATALDRIETACRTISKSIPTPQALPEPVWGQERLSA